jgi:hypothetical protein
MRSGFPCSICAAAFDVDVHPVHDRVRALRSRPVVVGVALQDEHVLRPCGEVVRTGRRDRLVQSLVGDGKLAGDGAEVGEREPRRQIGRGFDEPDDERVAETTATCRAFRVIGARANDVGGQGEIPRPGWSVDDRKRSIACRNDSAVTCSFDGGEKR